MKLNCLRCKADVVAEEVQSYNFREEEFDECLHTFKLLKCPHCGRPFLIEQVYDTSVFYSDDDFCTSDVKEEILYPKLDKNINSKLPKYIDHAFKEAQKCFKCHAFTASVIMCRKTLEGICKEYKIEKGNLQKKLENMKKNKIIDDNLWEWADTLRLAGNDAAHDLDIIFDKVDAQDSIDFTYALIDYIFTYRKAFELFKQRRQKFKLNKEKNEEKEENQ